MIATIQLRPDLAFELDEQLYKLIIKFSFNTDYNSYISL